MKKAALFLVLMLLCALPAPADSLQAAGPVEEADQASLAGYIIILYTGDTLGQADENLGFDRVAEAKERFAKEGAAVLLLDAGNAFPAPAEGEEDQSADIAKAMTKAGYDAMTPGEADFAGSARRLTALAKEAGFPLLSANAKDGDGAQLLSGSILVERDGLRIGVFGLTGNIEAEGLTVSSASKAAHSAVSTLRGEGCDVVIALSRLGLDESGASVAAALAADLDGLDIIIDMDAAAPEKGRWLDNGMLIVSGSAHLERIGIIAIDPSGSCAALSMDESWF